MFCVAKEQAHLHRTRRENAPIFPPLLLDPGMRVDKTGAKGGGKFQHFQFRKKNTMENTNNHIRNIPLWHSRKRRKIFLRERKVGRDHRKKSGFFVFFLKTMFTTHFIQDAYYLFIIIFRAYFSPNREYTQRCLIKFFTLSSSFWNLVYGRGRPARFSFDLGMAIATFPLKASVPSK